jgi:hypothetical protein
MKTHSRLVPFVAVLFLASCSSTQLLSTWKKPDVRQINFQRVVVIAAAKDPATRRAVEDQLVSRLRGPAVSSYTLSPTSAPVDEELHALIQNGHFDGAIVMRLASIDKETEWVPGTWSGPYYGYGYGYGTMDYWGMSDPGHYETNTVLRMETNVYELPSEQLIWAASSKTTNPKNLKELVNETIDIVAKQLKKEGLISEKPLAAR